MTKNIFEILDEVIDPSYKLSGGKITISENQKKKDKCEKVEIETSGQTFAFSLDRDGQLVKCFNNSIEDINIKNDGIVFYKESAKLIVLLIELKSCNKSKYLKQLKSGENFVKYLISQINLFYKINVDISTILFRGLLFQACGNRTVKQTTGKRNFGFEDRNGLRCATLQCNKSIKLQQIKEAIKHDKR